MSHRLHGGGYALTDATWERLVRGCSNLCALHPGLLEYVLGSLDDGEMLAFRDMARHQENFFLPRRALGLSQLLHAETPPMLALLEAAAVLAVHLIPELHLQAAPGTPPATWDAARQAAARALGEDIPPRPLPQRGGPCTTSS